MGTALEWDRGDHAAEIGGTGSLCSVRVSCHLAKDGSACLCPRPGKYRQDPCQTHHSLPPGNPPQPASETAASSTPSWAVGQLQDVLPSLQTFLSTDTPAELRTCSPCPSGAGGCHSTKRQSLDGFSPGWQQQLVWRTPWLPAHSLLLCPATCPELRLWVIFPSLFSSAAGIGATPGSAGLRFPRQ